MRIALQFALTMAAMLLAASSSLADSVSFTGPTSPYCASANEGNDVPCIAYHTRAGRHLARHLDPQGT